MNHAAVSAVPKCTVEAVSSFYNDCSSQSSIHFQEWMQRINEVRGLIAALINSRPGEVAFTGNTSDGLSIVASGFKWERGDKILVSRPDFPSNIYPWLNLEKSGVAVKFVDRRNGRLDADDFSKALEKGTKMIAVSSVDFVTGFSVDLEALGEFCGRKGIYLCVDGIQGLGVVPMDVKKFGAHFLASGGHKWLIGPMGCGFLYISPEANGKIHPNRVGWKSVIDEENFFMMNFELKSDALRFETGTMNLAGIYALGASLELLIDVGIDKIYERVLSLNDRLYSGLKERSFSVISPMDEGIRSGILSFHPQGNSGRLQRYLASKNVIVSLRNNFVRLAPHFYNSEKEIKSFFEIIDEFKKHIE
jgi:selenocysteine lyase/cysteine desulfurase